MSGLDVFSVELVSGGFGGNRSLYEKEHNNVISSPRNYNTRHKPVKGFLQ